MFPSRLGLIIFIIFTFYSMIVKSSKNIKQKRNNSSSSLNYRMDKKLKISMTSSNDLDEQGLPKVMTKEEYSDYLKKVDYYELVDMEHLEHKNHVEENFMANIIKQYRKDLGYPEAEDKSSEDLSSQIIPFLNCLNDQISLVFEDDIYSLEALTEAFDFLRYLGQIPRSLLSPEQCFELKSRLPFSNTEEMMQHYREEQHKFNCINWDYLDLTHFQYQKFPINDKIISTYEIDELYPFYRRDKVFTSEGRDLLKQYQEHIRFHNPNVIKGKRMLLFQDLYRLYLTGIGEKKANPYFIDWSHCCAKNWPSNVDHVDIDSWTEEQIETLSRLINQKRGRAGGIKFNFSRLKTKSKILLGNTIEFQMRPCITAHFVNDPIILEQDPITKKWFKVPSKSLSDSEEACGREIEDEEIQNIPSKEIKDRRGRGRPRK